MKSGRNSDRGEQRKMDENKENKMEENRIIKKTVIISVILAAAIIGVIIYTLVDIKKQNDLYNVEIDPLAEARKAWWESLEIGMPLFSLPIPEENIGFEKGIVAGNYMFFDYGDKNALIVFDKDVWTIQRLELLDKGKGGSKEFLKLDIGTDASEVVKKFGMPFESEITPKPTADFKTSDNKTFRVIWENQKNNLVISEFYELVPDGALKVVAQELMLWHNPPKYSDAVAMLDKEGTPVDGDMTAVMWKLDSGEYFIMYLDSSTPDAKGQDDWAAKDMQILRFAG